MICRTVAASILVIGSVRARLWRWLSPTSRYTSHERHGCARARAILTAERIPNEKRGEEVGNVRQSKQIALTSGHQEPSRATSFLLLLILLPLPRSVSIFKRDYRYLLSRYIVWHESKSSPLIWCWCGIPCFLSSGFVETKVSGIKLLLLMRLIYKRWNHIDK